MELPNAGNVGAGFFRLPIARQIGLMVGFAACVALAVAIVLWSQKPSYRMLYGNLQDQEVLEISGALDQAGIKYEVNEVTGAIMVDASQVHEARMKLAASGLPKGGGTGYELLDKEQGFGASQFSETTRYQRAIEGELAKTIGSLNNVQSARVHLAIPKQSAFVRDRKKPTASVMLSLYQGRIMSPEQASSISHLVASSVPNLQVEDVTVVDQNGRLLTKTETGDEVGRSNTQLEYRKNLEEYYIKRILEIIEPIAGVGKVKAQVAADLDFTVTEQTQESYNPDLPSIRSEQIVEEENTGASTTAGVPGTLSNQPAQAGSTVAPSAEGAATAPKNSARRSVKNYELDKTISHTRHQTGVLKRLSAAIVIDEKEVKNDAGEVSSKPLTDEEMAKITTLVKEAIGFDASRGDSVNVINAPFLPLPAPETGEEAGMFDASWLWDAGKQLLGVAAVALIIFVVLKPVLKSLAEKGAASSEGWPSSMESGDMVTLGHPQRAPVLTGPSYEKQLEVAKTIAKQEPHRVANIVKDWVEKDG